MKKAKQTMSVAARAYNYASEGMYVFDSKAKLMHCKFCNVRVDWERKSSVDNHVKSATHKSAKEKFKADTNNNSNGKRQMSVGDSFNQAKKIKLDREEFVKTVVHAFIQANIPLQKLDHKSIRKLFNTYMPGGGDLPSLRTLRDKYVPLLKQEYDADLQAKLKGRKIVVMSDETTNKKGEAVLVTLFKVLPSIEDSEPFLMVASVKILTAANADQVSKAIIQTLDYFQVDHENVVAVASDSAAYMNLCVKLLSTLVNPNIVHIQCWAHKMDKVGKVFQDKLPRLNEFVSNTKRLFKNTRKRKHKYKKFLKDKYYLSKAKEPNLFPMPVLTRWGSWRKSVQYVSEYVEDLDAYAKKLPDSDAPRAVKYFKKLSPENVKTIKAEADFVLEYCTPVCELILFLEGAYPMSNIIYSKISEVKNLFSVLNSASSILTSLYSKTKASVEALSEQKQKNILDRIKATSAKCHDIISDLLTKDTARSFLSASQTLFDPCKIVGGCNEKEVEKAKATLSILDPIPLPNFKVLHSYLCDNVKDKLAKGDPTKKKNGPPSNVVCDVLLGMKETYPEFVALCLMVLHVPPSNVDSERAFSAYNDIFSSKRTNLSAKNCEVMLCLYFGNLDDIEGSFSPRNSQVHETEPPAPEEEYYWHDFNNPDDPM